MLARWAANRLFEIEGLMTHLACAEEDSGVFSSRQVTIFQNFLTTLKKEWQPKNGAFPRWCHIANSEGVLHNIGSESVFNAIRPGLHLWGVQESPTLLTRSKELKPVASVRGRIRQIHHLQKGEGVGYGLSYKAKGPETVATVNLGYADGLRRDASQTSLGLYVQGKKFRFVGRVSMDLCAVALPERNSCVEGEWAYWICDEQNAETIALELGTISYEVLCACASRLHTVLIEGVPHG